jgi:hypothetical protein
VGLSDACFDFVDAVRSAASDLAEAIEWYSKPPYDKWYGEELDALRKACADAARDPWGPESAAQLIRLASAVLLYHDTPPGTPAEAERRAQMAKLVKLLRQSGLDKEDAAEVERIIPDVASETPRTEGAALKLKKILSKLGKATYDVAVNVISDIASETAKKILGL